MNLRDKLPELLQGESKSKLSEALGISRPTLNRYQKHPEEMPVKVLKKAAGLKGYHIKLEPCKSIYTL